MKDLRCTIGLNDYVQAMAPGGGRGENGSPKRTEWRGRHRAMKHAHGYDCHAHTGILLPEIT